MIVHFGLYTVLTLHLTMLVGLMIEFVLFSSGRKHTCPTWYQAKSEQRESCALPLCQSNRHKVNCDNYSITSTVYLCRICSVLQHIKRNFQY